MWLFAFMKDRLTRRKFLWYTLLSTVAACTRSGQGGALPTPEAIRPTSIPGATPTLGSTEIVSATSTPIVAETRTFTETPTGGLENFFRTLGVEWQGDGVFRSTESGNLITLAQGWEDRGLNSNCQHVWSLNFVGEEVCTPTSTRRPATETSSPTSSSTSPRATETPRATDVPQATNTQKPADTSTSRPPDTQVPPTDTPVPPTVTEVSNTQIPTEVPTATVAPTITPQPPEPTITLPAPAVGGGA